MRAEEPDNERGRQPQEDRDSIWSIPLARRALYFGLFTAYGTAGIGFLIWYEVFENSADTRQETILSITQGIGINTVGAAGLALLTIEGPQTVMVVADYLRKKLIEPLDERREERRNRLRKEGEASNQAAWEAWNERRLAAEANGETFDEPPPGTSSDKSE